MQRVLKSAQNVRRSLGERTYRVNQATKCRDTRAKKEKGTPKSRSPLPRSNNSLHGPRRPSAQQRVHIITSLSRKQHNCSNNVNIIRLVYFMPGYCSSVGLNGAATYSVRCMRIRIFVTVARTRTMNNVLPPPSCGSIGRQCD